MSIYYTLDDGGNPVPTDSVEEWARWFETADRSIASTFFGKARVSTVFLGMDHNFRVGGKPLLWETMIFGGKQDGYQERYSSKIAALEGHNRAVSLVRGNALARGLRWITEKFQKTSSMR